ncbi:snaclec coagulation factor IX/factor X-binding protein subunit A-like [Pollicipes pollicipes]|uniref:snaclec coagulation factor IX/factor X-binding protein subunit A-like n=1 Tax=Pollicipes pollicipes TaxID=41117 RepID=UPI001884D572|nr:snaclec coagulation factor IX/factor X-binding protein subunit A-like [Pollicipes pollicipes]
MFSHQREEVAAVAAGSAAHCGLYCQLESACTAVQFDLNGCRLLGCDPGWSGDCGNCYAFINDELRWTKAKEACETLHTGSQLASILSAEENQFVRAMVQAHNDSTRFVNIGLHYEPTWRAYEFRWLDGSPLNFTNWLENRPDGNLTRVLFGKMAISNGGWLDTRSYQRQSVCKYIP